MVVAVGFRANLMSLLGDVDLAANDRANAAARCFVVELDCPKKIAVIGHCNRRHVLLLYNLHQLFDVAGTIEKRVVGMAM